MIFSSQDGDRHADGNHDGETDIIQEEKEDQSGKQGLQHRSGFSHT
ncbi:hypothetical protein JXL19_08320 [bacterium]|nr:hypothetical protein [bacterium]